MLTENAGLDIERRVCVMCAALELGTIAQLVYIASPVQTKLSGLCMSVCLCVSGQKLNKLTSV